MIGAGAAVGRPLRQSDPAELGPYRLLRRIGEGGMGSVYLAQREEGSRLVALKVIRRDLANDPDFRRRFRGEVARAKQVPAFCTAEVLDADPDHEPPYLVVEFVNGPSLARVVQSQGPLSQANLHGLAIGVATALTAIHGAGVIHRDLKPANVLLALGSPKVIDFGIARAAEGTAVDTAQNMLMGTIPYMAPERLDPAGAKPLTPAADVFAWGAIVTYAGTGRPPFGGDSVESVARILTQPPDLTGLSGELRDLVERALAKDPTQRPTARELLDHLVGPKPNAERLIEAGSQQAVVSVSASNDTTRLAPANTPSPLPPLPRKKRKVAVPLLAIGLAMLTAIVAGLLTGAIELPGARAHSGTSPTPSVASPSPTLAAGTIRVQDSLASPGLFFQDNDLSATMGGKCVLYQGMTVTLDRPWTFRCPSKVDPLKDFSVEVEVTLRSEDSCAGIWFRFAELKGYLLSVCDDRYLLSTHNDTGVHYFRTFPLAKRTPLRTAFKVGVVVRGNQFTVYHDGEKLDTQDDDTYMSGGKVILGIAEPNRTATLRPLYGVEFKNIVIKDLSSSQP